VGQKNRSKNYVEKKLRKLADKRSLAVKNDIERLKKRAQKVILSSVANQYNKAKTKTRY